MTVWAGRLGLHVAHLLHTRSGAIGSLTCGMPERSVTAPARCCPWFARRVRTQRAPNERFRRSDAARRSSRSVQGSDQTLGSRLAPPENEVGDWHDASGADNGQHRGPQPLRASDLAGWPPLEVDERRQLEDAFGNGRDGEQSAGGLTEIAPLSSGDHDILVHGRDP